MTGRVKIHRVLNPTAWETRDTYLKVEGTINDDSGKKQTDQNDSNKLDEAMPAAGSASDVYGAVMSAALLSEESALKNSFGDLVDIQHDLEEDVRFTKAAKDTLAVKDGAGADGLWQTVRLWQNFVDQRLMARQNELQRDFQEKLQSFLQNEKGFKEDEIPRCVIGLASFQLCDRVPVLNSRTFPLHLRTLIAPLAFKI